MPLTLSFALVLAAVADPSGAVGYYRFPAIRGELDAAIRHLEERIREEPIKDLPPPAFPRRAVE